MKTIREIVGNERSKVSVDSKLPVLAVLERQSEIAGGEDDSGDNE